MLSDHYPDHIDDCPKPESINEIKASKAGITGDNCNTAMKVKRLVRIRLGEDSTEIDCHNHLRNTYLCTAVEKAFSTFLTAELQASLDNIDPRLRVSTLWLAFCRAYDKEFSLAANYPKGHGSHFLSWVKKYYLGVLLFHVESTHGGRQDIMYSSSLAMYINRGINAEFLDHCLKIPGE